MKAAVVDAILSVPGRKKIYQESFHNFRHVNLGLRSNLTVSKFLHSSMRR